MTTRLRGPFLGPFKEQNRSQRWSVDPDPVSDLKEKKYQKIVQQSGRARSNLPEPAGRTIQPLE